MKEYIKYANDYLLLKLKHYIGKKEEYDELRTKVTGKSMVAFLALTNNLKTIQRRIDSIMSILTNRGYTIEEIETELAKLPPS